METSELAMQFDTKKPLNGAFLLDELGCFEGGIRSVLSNRSNSFG